MMTPVKGLVLFLLVDFLQAVFGDVHSLEYLYTVQSKTSDSNIYNCTAVTLLDDRQIDFYNSTDKSRTSKQNWVKNIPQSDWKTRTEKLQYDIQLLHKLIDTQMNEFRHSESDDHVLQWRHGCVGERRSDGSVTLLNSSNEFGYDGEDLIQFNCSSKTWRTPEKKKSREREEKWSNLFHAVKKCAQCKEMLKIYLQYRTTEQYRTTDITQSQTPPAVHIFANKAVRDSSKLILTCLATGFYPKGVVMCVRKSGTSLPEHLLTSSGVRPNDDGTYQLRKSVEIPKDDSADYCCYVNHSSLTEPVIKPWDGRCTNCPNNIYQGVIIGGVAPGVLLILCFVLLRVTRRGRIKLVGEGYLYGEGYLCGEGYLPKKNNCDGGRNSQSLATSNVHTKVSKEDNNPLLQPKGAGRAGVSRLNCNGDAEDSTGAVPHPQFGPGGCLGVGSVPACLVWQDLRGSRCCIPGPTMGPTPKTNFT